MTDNNFRHYLIKIKEQFFSKLTTNKLTLTVEEVAQILYKHTHQQPITIRDFMLKAIGRQNMSWDDLLDYLQQDISIRDAVKKIQINPVSATEIIENHYNEFTKLIHYVKLKQTNSVQSIKSLPPQISGRGCYIVCFDKELAIFDYNQGVIIDSIIFKYSKFTQNIYEKEEHKRLLKQKQIQTNGEELLDKVFNLNIDRDKGLLVSNMKNSVRGSQMSSEKSNDRRLLRKLKTESVQSRRRQKANIIKIKNDDTKKIFQLFEEATINNSMTIAKKYLDSRANFNKYIALDKSLLEKQKKQKRFELSSIALHRNFKKQLQQMKQSNNHLSKVRKSFDSSSSKYCNLKANSFFDNEVSCSASKMKKTSITEGFAMENTILQILQYSVFEKYLLVSLFSRQIRLVAVKRSLNRIVTQTIFQKRFKQVVIFLQMYLSAISGSYKIILALQKTGKPSNIQKGNKGAKHSISSITTEVHIYQLDESKKIKSKTFQQSFQFSTKCQMIVPTGLILFNQKGCFSLIQLDNLCQKVQEKIAFNLILYNPTTKYRICINQVRFHKRLMNLYLCCASGYVYLFDKLCKQIKYHTRINPSPVLDMCLIKNDQELIALYANGNMAILSAINLQKIYLYQSYHDIFAQSKLLSFENNKFYIYTPRDIVSYLITENEEKKFNNVKPMKIFKNRSKLKQRQNSKIQKDKQKVIKVIEGTGGHGHFISLLFECGQICVLDHETKYVGSYYYFNVSSIIHINCNESYQFLSILTEDYHFQVVNLYTQNTLFKIQLQQFEPKDKSIPSLEVKNNIASDVVKSIKPAKSNKVNIKFSHFFSQNTGEVFLAVVSQQNVVYHYTDKGLLINSVNLQKSCGQKCNSNQMLYQQNQLLFLTKGQITVLHRKSYLKKFSINVSVNDLIKIKKKVRDNANFYLCADNLLQVFLVDINLRKATIIYGNPDTLKYQYFFYNQYMILKQQQHQSRLIFLKKQQEIQIKTNLQNYIYIIVSQNMIRISKNSGKLSKLNYATRQFQQINI